MADTDEIAADDPRDAEKPRGRTSLTTKVLMISNFLAILGFGALLYLDFDKRQEWAKAVFQRDLAAFGLPFDDKDTLFNHDAAAQVKYELDPPLLRQAYKERGGSLTEKFLPVDESFNANIRFADLDETLLAGYFRDAGAGTPAVATIKTEIEDVKKHQLGAIDAVARDVADKAKGKKASEKRALLKKILFPICSEGWQVVKLNDKIEKTPEDKLSEFLMAAAQRRLLFDILQPLELFRPTEKVDPPDPEKVADPKFKKLLVDRAADLDTVSVDDLKKHFLKRCDDVLAGKDWIYPLISRPDFEKRRFAAFLLTAISQVEIPGADRPPPGEAEKEADPNPPLAKDKKGDAKDGNQPEKKQAAKQKQPERPFAFPKAKRRAEAICGLRNCNQACEDLAIVNGELEKQTVAAIRRDLGLFRNPLTARIYDPKKFAEQLLGMMKKLNVSIPNEAAFRKAVEDRLTDLKGKIDGTDVLLVELRKVIPAQQVRIPETVDQAAFEREVDAILNANAIGFLGKYQMTLQRIQSLAKLVERRQRQYMEAKNIEDEETKQLQARVVHEEGILDDWLKARAKTREMAEALQALQQELFIAQVNLAGAHEYNLYLADHLRELERQTSKLKGGQGK